MKLEQLPVAEQNILVFKYPLNGVYSIEEIKAIFTDLQNSLTNY